jgi:beta-fructofuranosidase
VHEAPLAPVAGETLRLRVFLDRSSVEVFAQDGRVVLTDLVYADAASLGVALGARSGRARLVGLRSWRLAR